MEIEKHLAELAQADPQARRTALENALTAEGLTPEIQECEADERRKAATICCIRPTRTPKDRCSAPITTHTPAVPAPTITLPPSVS